LAPVATRSSLAVRPRMSDDRSTVRSRRVGRPTRGRCGCDPVCRGDGQRPRCPPLRHACCERCTPFTSAMNPRSGKRRAPNDSVSSAHRYGGRCGIPLLGPARLQHSCAKTTRSSPLSGSSYTTGREHNRTCTAIARALLVVPLLQPASPPHVLRHYQGGSPLNAH
jgi:hypothetical protein